MKTFTNALLILGLCITPVASAEDWSFGIGTGISALDVDGDGGFNTRLLGPIDFDASLEPDQVRDLAESAFGLGGFARKGPWTLTYSVGRLTLEEDVSAVQGGNSGTLDLNFETNGAEFLVHYAFTSSGKHTWSVIGGLRYTDQEYEVELVINGNEVFDGSVDDDWTDGILGLSYSYAFSNTLSWNTQVDYGFGGTDGTAHFNTGLSKVSGNWMFIGALDFKAIDYEEGNRGDSDWYLYDADETILGISFMYLY